MKYSDELQALHDNLKIEDNGRSFMATRNQITGVITLMLAGLEDKSRENRIRVLRELVEQPMLDLYNRHVNSTNDITERMALFLIRQFKKPYAKKHQDDTDDPWELSDYGAALLYLVEKRIETGVEANADQFELTGI